MTSLANGAGSTATAEAGATAEASAVAPASAVARPWRRALAWLAFLGPFFFISYGFANWWAGQLAQVESVVFGWELHIPFLDWTILPYMSIDAFYAVSLFVCATRAELDAHARRLFAATLISVACFLLFPLQFSFARPETSGFNGMLFDILTGFDKPFNQAPSLHISLLLLLWVVYARHLRGAVLWLLHVWFALIGISVFTTFQHHVIDGFTGFAVGVICLYLFPDAPLAWSRHGSEDAGVRRRLQRYYLTGAALCLALAYGLRGWAWLLLWPGAALFLVGLAYVHFGPAVFQKRDGCQSRAARILLAPYRVGAWLSSRWFTRAGAPSAEVAPGIWIGRAPGGADWRHFQPAGMLDLTAEFHAGANAARLHHRNVPMLDLVAPTQSELRRAVAALDELHARNAPVLVHCALGYSRSALVVAAWLLRRNLVQSPAQAIARVRATRPQIVLNPAFEQALAEFARG
ncbi:phosphatase PAP2/dual specificity phosphatase family protein [Janthinobacterium sp. 17J80-10]|uniref:phosphatase PAP2/dual specificity phosphatase family protein n=1 Tax=Janthinobacterium sp. 17J80-10 TaxID=2497863 RepID=UPI00100572D6|nr:phosphatase PAP2/dual specificity phosphatase family protein [Janthinobacterium sp. 17J80-10]QAU33182.1 phosphatase PAP2 family protein [Janthinobacterium sp. 17J80-10]